MRKHDRQLQVEGFGMPAAIAAGVLPQLIEAFEAERDHGLSCWLLELIGDARSTKRAPALDPRTASGDESLRDWARRGLTRLDTKAAHTLLWQESQNRTT
jgi:hypothetical protein